jgi:hypothetical protein
MKVMIILEDTTQGIFPTVKWQGNGVTDNIETSISMTMAAQIAYLLRRATEIGALKIVDQPTSLH